MNRKLVNGLLLLTIGAVGCGTFTSCKDTDEDYKNEIMIGQADIQKALAKVQADIAALDSRVATLESEVAILQANQCKCNLEQIRNFLQMAADGTVTIDGQTYATISDYVNAQVDPLKEDIADLQTLTQAIVDRIQTLPTDLILNQTYNQFFGTLNLPVGVQSNIIGNYYYLANHDVVFPFGPGAMENDLGDDNAVIAGAALNPATVTLNADQAYMEGSSADNNLGQLYVTVNPNYIDFTGGAYALSLVKSNGEVAPVTLTPAATDEVLTFGYTRAGQGNLYRLNAYVDPTQENLDELDIDIEDGLKSTMKSFLKDPNRGDLLSIAKAVLDQMDGFLPAYGVKAAWQSQSLADGTVGTAEPYFLVSKYEVAATTFKPLSMGFMEGQGINKQLPTFGPVTEAFNNIFNDLRGDIKLEIKFDKIAGLDPSKIDIKLSGFSIDIEETSITVQPETAEIKIFSKDDPTLEIGQGTYDPEPIVLTYDPSKGVGADDAELNEFVNHILAGVEKALNGTGEGSLSAELNKQIKEQVVGQVNDMVANINKQLEGINGQISSQIGTILDKIQNQLSGKLGAADKLVNLYNKLAEKINGYLKDPQALLMPFVAYKDAAGNLHHLSTDANQPSVFVKNGGNAAELYLTSYTGELIAPAYKKYVAITLDGANVAAGSQLNTVLPGRQLEVAVDASALQAGKTYKVIYSALDYRGRTATRAYYMVVK